MTDNREEFVRQWLLRGASNAQEQDGNTMYADFDMGKWLKGVPYQCYQGDMPVKDPWSFEKSITAPKFLFNPIHRGWRFSYRHWLRGWRVHAILEGTNT